MPTFKDQISSTNLDTDFKRFPEYVTERTEWLVFLTFYSLFIFFIIGLIRLTLSGHTLLPERIDNYLYEISNNIFPNQVLYVGVVNYILCLANFLLVRLALGEKSKKEVKVYRIIVGLFISQSVAILFRFVLPQTPNGDAILKTLGGLVSLVMPIYFLFFLPKKYLEVLAPYSFIFLILELQKLRQEIDTGNRHRIRACKNRARLYLYSFIFTINQSLNDSFPDVLTKRFVAIYTQSGSELKQHIDTFLQWFSSELKLPIPGPQSNLSKQRQLMQIENKTIFKIDGSILTIAMTQGNFTKPDLIGIWSRGRNPMVRNSRLDMQLVTDFKDLKKALRLHIKRANEFSELSARQKLDSILVFGIVYLFTPMLMSLVKMNGKALQPKSWDVILIALIYISSGVVTIGAARTLETKFRKMGINVWLTTRAFRSYIIAGSFLWILFGTIGATDEFSSLFFRTVNPHLQIYLIVIMIIQIIFLIFRFRPPADLRVSSIANSLLVRELLLLHNKTLIMQNVKDRKDIGRHIFYIKKYFRLITKDLISNQFDSKTQKMNVREFFRAVNNFIDELSVQIKLGTEDIYESAIPQIEAIIKIVAIGNYGDLPNKIPELRERLNIESIQPKPLSLGRQIIQLFDTSGTARTVFIILVVIILNLLNPTLWSYLQNISSLAQLITP